MTVDSQVTFPVCDTITLVLTEEVLDDTTSALQRIGRYAYNKGMADILCV